MFAPKEEYIVQEEKLELRDIREYPDRFILRPPYQRHSGVWSNKMKLQLLDSVCREYYIPKIVLRKIRLSENLTKLEVIDGQQRLSTILEFFKKDSNLRLPKTLKDISSDLPGKKYHELEADKREWFDKQLCLKADVIINIENKEDVDHTKIASDLFWRLQQGEPLTFIETLHSRLYSNVRNFVSKHADTYSFDYEQYTPKDDNPDIHSFFGKVIDISNDRMQYLLLLTRFLMVEFADGPTDVGDKKIKAFFDKFPVKTNSFIAPEFIARQEVKDCLSNMNVFYAIFKDNSMIDKRHGVKYLKKDYFILSLYILLRHMKKYYVFEEKEYKAFDNFAQEFYKRLVKNDEDDSLIMQFRDNRQQSTENLSARERIMRRIFFEKNKNLVAKDTKRSFDESEKIEIYMRDKGICKLCCKEYLTEGLPQEEAEEKAKVTWSDYDADHIKAHIKGGRSVKENAQVLCKRHNRAKGSN